MDCWPRVSTRFRPKRSERSRRRPWWAGSSGRRRWPGRSATGEWPMPSSAWSGRVWCLPGRPPPLPDRSNSCSNTPWSATSRIPACPSPGERVDEFAELVAHHYVTAVAGEDADLAWAEQGAAREAVRESALEALLHAGSLARRRFAVDRAIELHQRALGLAASNRERARALDALGDDHFALFHGDEAVEAYRQAIALLESDPELAPWGARIAAKAAGMITEKSGAFRIQPD